MTGTNSKSIALAVCISVALASGACSRKSAEDPVVDEPVTTTGEAQAQSLEISSIELLGGEVWSLGAGPFGVRFVLSNESEGPIMLWDPSSVEGRPCARLRFDSPEGGVRELSLPAVGRSGAPTTITLEPGGERSIVLELTALAGANDLGAGQYRIEVVYENDLSSAMGAADVWTGRIVSETREIELRAN